jgi:hypothetical protein
MPPAPPPGAYGQPPPGLISMQAQGLEQRPNGEGVPDFDPYHYGPRNGFDQQQVDMTFTSASPIYGSPPQAERMATSPPPKGLSVLDAPLPNSFDSNGISFAARNGHLAASVPARFGMESPPSSLPRQTQFGNTALRDLHSSAFGDRGMDGVLASMGSSPPSGPDGTITFAKRPLHSERLRTSRPPIMSSSLGTKLPTTSFEYSDDEDGPDGAEDLLPASIRDIISEGGSRHESRVRSDEDSPANFLSAARRTLSGHGTPQDSKVSSLGTSPSRYSSVFLQRQGNKNGDGDGIGHVGSPLRNSGFTSSPRPGNGELSPSISSPPKQASMSMLSQELQRTKLDAARSQAQPPTRSLSNGSNGRSSLDRGMSSTSVSKIDEEQELFDMDEVAPNGDSFGAIGGHRAEK